MFVVSIALYVPGEYWIRTGFCCLGALWAMLLSLALWPLQSSSPVFDALEISYLKLAELLEAFWSGTTAGDRPVNNLGFALAFDSFITQLESARTIWGAIRARRAGPAEKKQVYNSLLGGSAQYAASVLREDGKRLASYPEIAGPPAKRLCYASSCPDRSKKSAATTSNPICGPVSAARPGPCSSGRGTKAVRSPTFL